MPNSCGMHLPSSLDGGGGVKISENSLLEGSEVFVLGGEGFLLGGGRSRNFEVEIKTA